MIFTVLIGLLVLLILLMRTMLHLISRNPHVPNDRSPEDLGLNFQKLRINTENNKKLHAWYIKNEMYEAPALVVIMHGWSRNASRMLDCADEMYQEGYDVLLPDARNHGDSDEDFYSSLKMFREDLVNCVQFARAELLRSPDQRILLLGHSIGGSASILAAEKITEVAAVVTTGAFADPKLLIAGSLRKYHVPYFPFIPLLLHYIQYRLKSKFSEFTPVIAIKNVNANILLVHGSRDTVVDRSSAAKLADACHKCSVLLIKGAGHSNLRTFPEFYPEIKSFFKNNI